MYTDEWRYLNEIWLHYQDWPTENASRPETVLLLHGLTQQSHAFDAVAARLTPRHRCVALDLRGRGESGWAAGTYAIPQYLADVLALLDALGLDAVHVLGTSLGGLIGLSLAGAAPDRLRSLTLNDIGPEIDPRGAARVAAYAADVPERFPDLTAVTEWALAQYPWLSGLQSKALTDAIRWAVRRVPDGGWRLKFDPAIGRPPPPRTGGRPRREPGVVGSPRGFSRAHPPRTRRRERHPVPGDGGGDGGAATASASRRCPGRGPRSLPHGADRRRRARRLLSRGREESTPVAVTGRVAVAAAERTR